MISQVYLTKQDEISAKYVECMDISQDSDVFQLGILQEMLLDLNKKNFLETKDWIVESIFASSDEGIHDLIYTFYLIASARAHEKRGKLFSRMIRSLYESRKTNEYLARIPNQCDEILVLAVDMNAGDLIGYLIRDSIVDQSKYTNVSRRKRSYALDKSTYSESIIKLKNYKIIYPYFADKKNLLEESIRNDDVDELQKIIINENEMNFGVNLQLKFHEYLINFSLIEYSAFSGSIKCFKYLLLNKAEISCHVAYYAVRGGNIEIIRILEQNKKSVESALLSANTYFANDIFDWIIDTKETDLTHIKTSENVHVIKFIAEMKQKISDSFLQTNYIILTKYFLSHFNEFSYTKRTFFMASINGNIGLLKYLISSNKSCLYETIDRRNLLHLSCCENRVEVVEYLLNISGIAFNDQYNNIFEIAFKNRSYELIRIFCELKGIVFTKIEWKWAIETDSVKIIKILMKHDWISSTILRKRQKFIYHCIGCNSIKIFKYFLSLEDFFCPCVMEVFHSNYQVDKIEFLKAIYETIQNYDPDQYFNSSFKIWDNIDLLEQFIIISCYKNQKYGDFYTKLAQKLLTSAKFTLTDGFFISSLITCYNCYDASYKNIKWILTTFSELVIRNLDMIFKQVHGNMKYELIYLIKKYIKCELVNVPIKYYVEPLVIMIQNGSIEKLKEFIDILPEIFETPGYDLPVILAAKNNVEIMKILLNIPNVNFYHDQKTPLEFLTIRSKSFDLIINHPKADLNCADYYSLQKISLLLRLAIEDDLDHFSKLLEKEGIDVNYRMMMWDDENERYYPNYTLIHYLIVRGKNDMLKILLEYPSIDADISVENIVPISLALHLKNYDAIKLLIGKSKSKVDITDDVDRNVPQLIKNIKQIDRLVDYFDDYL